ncbi:histone H3 domain-containing protein [Dictyostelium discoideum AX4]|uniref:Histone H3.v2 n=1 Tax=Dictyostelium discoideum TaxID=44689 RepID=H3V2_DICDI|nr:histone H3 domain-containing protein [Dictyostelium discoideum AX4]Q54Z07.1 RecName: Full=Histone H3.v2 [Dictyostelium discoideum]EAL68162.1 histone H3 domain-containing protein [Dictyostelium discoideum AX4]|eukprot:XP_642045.1 histone H3 domain-containing protein [Dictyostelium discoideum AX4]
MTSVNNNMTSRRNLVLREIKRQILWAWTDPKSYRMSVGAIHALRTAFECYMNIIMTDCAIMAAHGKRKTITDRDIAFHQYIKPFYLPRY